MCRVIVACDADGVRRARPSGCAPPTSSSAATGCQAAERGRRQARAGSTGCSWACCGLYSGCGKREGVARQFKGVACGSVYCGRSCQKEHWTKHRAVCGRAGADRPDGPAQAMLLPGDEALKPHAG